MAGPGEKRGATCLGVWKKMHLGSSMAKGLELGIVRQLPVVINRTTPNDSPTRSNPLQTVTSSSTSYLTKAEKAAMRNPLNTLEYNRHSPELFKT
jgi:hypothetical protein